MAKAALQADPLGIAVPAAFAHAGAARHRVPGFVGPTDDRAHRAPPVGCLLASRKAATSASQYRTSLPIFRYVNPLPSNRHFRSVLTLQPRRSAASISFSGLYPFMLFSPFPFTSSFICTSPFTKKKPPIHYGERLQIHTATYKRLSHGQYLRLSVC